MKKRIGRPKRRDIKSVIKQVSVFHNSLLRILEDEATLRHNISELVKPLRAESAREQLRTTELETLNTGKQGLRLWALKEAGYKNVGQLQAKSAAQLAQIKGLGPSSASKILEAIERVSESAYKSAIVRIDPHKRNRRQSVLLTRLYTLRKTEASSNEARRLLALYTDLPENLKRAKTASRVFSWVFSRHYKKEVSLQAYEYLNNLLDTDFAARATKILENYYEVGRGNPKKAYADFGNHSIAYYTLLESLGFGRSTIPATGLPDKLVAEIDKYPLDLQYMKVNLRRYQIFGAKYMLQQGRALLGDEMGLGKTIEALAVMADLTAKGVNHFLVVCPAGILINWKREVENHTYLESFLMHGHTRAEEFERWKSLGGVGITNYESLAKLSHLLDFEYGALIADEAHYVKNPAANRTKELRKIAHRTKRLLYMTGTPLENRVDEMCFLVQCLRADIAQRLIALKNQNRTSQFRKEIGPVYLRRLRKDVISELPELIESEDWVVPSTEELGAYYQGVAEGNFMAMRRISWDVALCKSSKALRLASLCQEAAEENRKVIVFSFFIETLNKVKRLLGSKGLGPITGGTSSIKRQELIDQFTAADREMVLISQVQAGGVGVNIQAASVVIFCEPQLKPSTENQALSRAYRMGQLRDVQVHRLLCVGTIDERMITLLRGKQQEFDTYAAQSVVGRASIRRYSESSWTKKLIQQEQALLASRQNTHL